jgi:hypothetical protein
MSPPLGTILQEVFNLHRADRIEIFLRGLKRRSDAEAARRRADGDDVFE